MTCVRRRDALGGGRAGLVERRASSVERASRRARLASSVERRARLAYAHMSPIADAGAVAKYLADAGAVARYLAGISPALQAVVFESTRLPPAHAQDRRGSVVRIDV